MININKELLERAALTLFVKEYICLKYVDKRHFFCYETVCLQSIILQVVFELTYNKSNLPNFGNILKKQCRVVNALTVTQFCFVLLFLNNFLLQSCAGRTLTLFSSSFSRRSIYGNNFRWTPFKELHSKNNYRN